MANTQKYLNHLLQNTGITPACSEEERAAGESLADIFRKHGFEPEVQEFTASNGSKIAQAVLGIMTFAGTVLMGIGGALGVVGVILVVAAAVLFAMERSGRKVISSLGRGGLSQNVIAYHKASGPLASPRNRPVVVVAHYDSPRADLLAQAPYAAYRPLIMKLLPFAMLAPAIIALIRMMPLPAAAKTVLWVIALLAALVPLALSVSIIANKFVLPYTSGSVCNKSSVAAMLGVMDAVAPYQGSSEFHDDVPFEEFMAEEQRLAAEAAAAAVVDATSDQENPYGVTGVGVVPEVDDEFTSDLPDAPMDVEVDPFAAPAVFPADQTSSIPVPAPDQTSAMPVLAGSVEEDAPAPVDMGATVTMSIDEMFPASDGEPSIQAAEDEAEDATPDASVESASIEPVLPVNAAGNIRYGTDVLQALGMVDASCKFVYEDGALPTEPELDDARAADEGADQPAAEPEVVAAPVADDADLPEEVFDAVDFEQPQEPAEPVAEPALELQDESDPSVEVAVDSEPEFVYQPPLDYILEAEYEVIEPEVELESDQEEAAAPSEELDAEQAQEVESVDPGSTVAIPAVEEGTVSLAATVEVPAIEVDESEAPAVSEEAPAAVDAEVSVEADSNASEDEESSDVPSDDDAAPAPEVEAPAVEKPLDGDTQLFEVPGSAAPQATQAMPVQRPVETVDSLMAQISQPAPQQRPQRQLNVPTPAAPPRQIPNVPGIEALQANPVAANRSTLFDLPDPSVKPADPFAMPSSPSTTSAASRGFSVVEGPSSAAKPEPVETISAPAPAAEKPRRGLGKLFGRKKKQQESMSDWLGVDDDFDAKRNGGEIGSWDNFDDDGWKGGSTGVEGVSDQELRDAITSMGDDELLGHDIWFVATGASECDGAGIKAFLETHRDKLRGVFLINLESVGAGQLAMLSTEGEGRTLKGDKRIMKLVQRVSADFHHEFGAVDMPFLETDAYSAMSMSLRSLTIAGVDSSHFACSHTVEDQPYNVDEDNVCKVADVVTEVIRRS